jgi:Ion channel
MADAARIAGRHRYGAVLLLALAVALFALVTPDGRVARAIELGATGATLLVAVLTSNAPERTRRIAAGGLAVVVAAIIVASWSGWDHPALTLAATAALLVSSAAVILAGLVRLILERGVVLQAVLGALAIYVLVGLTFGFVVGALAAGADGPYFAQGTDAAQNQRVYYSFTVLTTTGFGDFTAATRTGRALAVLEMLLGQLYLVTVIGLLVGNLRRRRQ